jgi:hypothetical protein
VTEPPKKRKLIRKRITAEVLGERRISKRTKRNDFVFAPADDSVKPKLVWFRHQSMIDYVTDPEARSLEWHYNRPDRDYKAYLSDRTFSQWAAADGWRDKREVFWQRASLRVLEQEQDRIVKQQREELAQLAKVRDHLVQHLMPLEDDDGGIMVYPDEYENGDPHPLAGKPVLPYVMQSYDKAIKAYLEVDQRIMLKRGEVTQRTEGVALANAEGEATTSPLNPTTRTSAAHNFTPEQVRAMARTLLRQQQPNLEPINIDLDENGEPNHDAEDTI